MGKQTLSDALILCAGYDLSGDMNETALTYGVDAKENTTFGDDTHIYQAGLKKITVTAKGYWEVTKGGVLFNAVGTKNIVTLGPNATEGDRAFFFQALNSDYAQGGQVGELLPFSFAAQSGEDFPDLVAGILAANKTGITSSGNGTGFQLGAVGSGHKLYGALHVLSAGGTTPQIAAIVESDSDNTFASPTTVLTFSDFTSVGAEIQMVDGPITDTWFRISYTLTGTSPDFAFVLALGIL